MSVSAHPVLRREREWAEAVRALLGPDADLVAVSRWIPDSRAYANDDRIAIVRFRDTAGAASGGLETAAEALDRLHRPVDHVVEESWEALLMPRVEGNSLEFALTQLPTRERLRVLGRVRRELAHIHAQGVAHRDLRPDNVLLRPDGEVEIVDFDRALIGEPRRTALADWVGIGPGGFSENAFWSLALFTLVPRSRSLGRRVRGLVRKPRSYVHEWAEPASVVPDDVRLLARAWSIAQLSGANAPGQGLAYYAFTYRGHHLPGERPWDLRWEAIRRAVDFEGKALLELGCNMGLLSCYALLHGARSAVGIDRDSEIVEAARLVAQALGVQPELRQVDLSAAVEWEADLRGADIVTALSIVHWLPDPDRVLRFLGKHQEVIYEGHDPLDVEKKRLESVGFRKVEVVLESERGRFVLHGRR